MMYMGIDLPEVTTVFFRISRKISVCKALQYRVGLLNLSAFTVSFMHCPPHLTSMHITETKQFLLVRYDILTICWAAGNV